jgi:NAD(P) transhydrogenase
MGAVSRRPIPFLRKSDDQEGANAMNYELLVIGNGREAIDEALRAAQQRQRVALVETVTVDEAAASVNVLRQAVRNLAGADHVGLGVLRDEALRLARCQRAADRAELECLRVDVFSGEVRFVEANTLELRADAVPQGDDVILIRADNLLVACGTKSARPGHFRFDNRLVHDPTSWLRLDALPRTMVVIGAGDTGLDYSILLARLGVDVTVVDEQANVLELCGGLMEDARLFEAQSLDIAFRLGDAVIGVASRPNLQVVVRLASGKSLLADGALVCVGRIGDTDRLNLEAAGVGLDERGRVWCDANGRTWAPHIRAIGDVIGFSASDGSRQSPPILASSA